MCVSLLCVCLLYVSCISFVCLLCYFRIRSFPVLLPPHSNPHFFTFVAITWRYFIWFYSNSNTGFHLPLFLSIFSQSFFSLILLSFFPFFIQFFIIWTVRRLISTSILKFYNRSNLVLEKFFFFLLIHWNLTIGHLN